MLLAITKKIYPTSGSARQLFDKLGRSINADHNAATMFQIVEFAIEAVAIHAILNSLVSLFQASGGAASGWIGWGIVAFVWAVSIGAAATIQVQYTSNLYMPEQVKHDENLLKKIGQEAAATYNRNSWILFAFCLVLNAWGGFILLSKVTFKADKSQIAVVEKSYNEAKAGMNSRYNEALGEAKKYDEQIAQSRTVWSKYAANKPNEKSYADKKMKEETSKLLARKTEIIEAATADRKAELAQETDAFEKNKTALIGAVQGDLDKQYWQEVTVFVLSLAFSFVMLILVGMYHRRATRNELHCGIKYVLQMPSNEEQSALNSFAFLGKFALNGIGQTVAVAGFFVAQKLLRTRLNLSGYNDTAPTQNVLKQTKIELAQAQAEAEQQAREAAKNRVENVPFEVDETEQIDHHHPAQNEIGQHREKQTERKQFAPVRTENNAPTVENSGNENSITENNAIANSTEQIANSQNENSTSPTANSANKRVTLVDIFRAEQAAKKQAGERVEQPEMEQLEAVELDVKKGKIAKSRADANSVNKTQTTAEWRGKIYTLRTLDTMSAKYLERSKDATFSPEARLRNAVTYSEIIDVLNSTIQTNNEQQS